MGSSVRLVVFHRITMTQFSILENHYQKGSGCWDRVTNMEVMFAFGDDSLVLHQGESGILDAYQVNLEVARIVEYGRPGDCLDGGVNGDFLYDCQARCFPITASRRTEHIFIYYC